MNIRLLLSELVRIGLEAVTPYLPQPRVIADRSGTSPYLSRWYLFGGPRSNEGSPFDATGMPKKNIIWRDLPFNLYLHKFHRGDDDEALHSHPWGWALSFILAGGYSEERRERVSPRACASYPDGYEVKRRLVLPFSFNFISVEDFHRVDLLDEEGAWSLFLAGPKADTWYFWDRHTGQEIPWRKFIFNLRGGAFKET